MSSVVLGQPREIAVYLVALRPILKSATGARAQWVRRLGVLMADTRHGNVGLIAQAAASIGREHVQQFRDARIALDRLRPPRECASCHDSLASWIDKLVLSSEVMIDVGRSGDITRMRETQSHLSDGRLHAQRFNAEYARLVADLRTHVQQASARRSEAARERELAQSSRRRDAGPPRSRGPSRALGR